MSILSITTIHKMGVTTMRKRMSAYVLATALGLGFAGSAFSAQGPTQAPLTVSGMYVTNSAGTIYVAFNSGAMPGCYANAGGYLSPTSTYFKEIYAQLLMMVATGGVKAAVLYTQNTPTNNWGDCNIDGIYLLP